MFSRLFSMPGRVWMVGWCLLLVLGWSPRALHGQRVEDPAGMDAVNTIDPSEVFLKAFSAVQKGDQLQADGKLKQALSRYRFAASLLEQLSQTNPNWQPLIVNYRIRKTTESIRKVEEKAALQPPPIEPTVTVPGATRPGAVPAEDDDLPVPDAPATYVPNQPVTRPGGPAPVETLSSDTMALSAKSARMQEELKAAQTALAQAQKDRQDALQKLEESQFKENSRRSQDKILQKRLDRFKSERDDLQKQLDQAQSRLTEFRSKNPEANETRKELRTQVANLTKSLAKAEADTTAAQKERDAANQKLTEAEGRNSKVAAERDEALAKVESTRDAAERIRSLETENEALNQKLAAAETSIAQLSAEAVKKKGELEGMQKELTAVKDQLATTRDQQDRSETTITELRQKLDDDAKQLADLKSKGATSEEVARMTNENNLLKGIVIRQLKVDANRALARKLVSDELARLEVQSTVLNEQIEQLGRPTVPLTEEERKLLRDPEESIAASADANALASKITAIKPKTDEPAEGTARVVPPPGAANTGGEGVTAAGAPQVDLTSQPKVSEELQPMAREAEESFHRGRFAEAEETYKKLLARDPKNIYLLSNQGAVLSRQNKLKSAEITLKKALAVDPKDAYTLATLGIVYYRMHRFDDALEYLTKAVQYDPKNATAHNYLGITSSQKGWPEAALEEVQKAIALNPQYADAHFNIAVIYATSQPPSKEQAQEHYRKATELGAAPDPALEKLLKKK